MADPTPTLDPVRDELARRVARHAPRDGTHRSAIDALTLMRAQAPTLLRPSLYEPGLVIVAQGRKCLQLGGRHYVYDARHGLIVAMTVPAASQVTEASPGRPYLSLRIAIDAATIMQLLDELRLHTPLRADKALPQATAAGHDDQPLAAAPLDEPLIDAVLRLMRLLDAPDEARVLAPLVLREIHYRVLRSPLGPHLRDVLAGQGRAPRIAPAMAQLKQRYTEPMSIAALAAAAHMSASSLHHHFKTVTSMSPLQYQKQLRLHEARRLMLVDGLSASAAAYRVGYESASQFSREFRRLFGAPPRAEIERVLASELAPAG